MFSSGEVFNNRVFANHRRDEDWSQHLLEIWSKGGGYWVEESFSLYDQWEEKDVVISSLETCYVLFSN